MDGLKKELGSGKGGGLNCHFSLSLQCHLGLRRSLFTLYNQSIDLRLPCPRPHPAEGVVHELTECTEHPKACRLALTEGADIAQEAGAHGGLSLQSAQRRVRGCLLHRIHSSFYGCNMMWAR